MPQDALPLLDEATALFLDVDGTLVDIAPKPDAVAVPPALLPVLRRLEGGLGGALALVSGRSLANLDALFAPLRLAAAGQHGAELRRCGELPADALARDPALDGLARRATDFAAARPGLLAEDKGLSLVIHYRQAPHRGEEVQRFAAQLLADTETDLMLIPLHMGFELKPRAASKRSAIEWFMRAPPFLGRVPLFIGDDRTDEDGFAATLALGGHAVRVGFEQSSIAPARIADPRAVRAWLATAADSLPSHHRSA